MPRFQIDALAKNVERLEQLRALASRRRCAVAQLSLVWLLAQSDAVAAIPGTKRSARLEENLAATTLQRSPAELAELDAICPPGAFSGERFGPADMARVAQ